MKLSDFDYNLPKELIAQFPLEARDASRMMVLDRNRRTITHKHFKDITSYLRKGDAVVLNDSKVIPARIPCRRETGGKAEIFILNKVRENLYEALVRPASKLFSGKKLLREDGRVLAEVVENRDVGRLVRFADTVDIDRDLKDIGGVPLPPYIKRKSNTIDTYRYQTVYAKKDGSTASPTAGLHFTEEMLAAIKKRSAAISYVTLHVSYGTFAPVKTEEIERHRMHKEFFELSARTQEIVRDAGKGAGRVIAVGTTAARVLEANADTILKKGRGMAKDVRGQTGLYIYPPYEFKLVGAMLTNFHLPKSTLLMLVSAFTGHEFIMEAYREAVKERYRFFSYGDCMLIV